MAHYITQTLELIISGDGTSTAFSYDLSKPPLSVGFTIGLPSTVKPVVIWNQAPQIGVDQFNAPIYDEPSTAVSLVGTTLTITFGTALKSFGSTFTDGSNNQWPIGPYVMTCTFTYNSLS